MTKIINTTIKRAGERLSKRKTQRLSIDLDNGSNLEILICPLGDDWEKNRLSGTDKKYCGIGIMNYGFYPLRLDGNLGASYVASKLGLPYNHAEELVSVLNKIKINFYE